MANKRVMPDMFNAQAPVRPPKINRPDSKFSHHLPETREVEQDAFSNPNDSKPVEVVQVSEIEPAPKQPLSTSTALSAPVISQPEVPAKQKRIPKPPKVESGGADVRQDDIWAAFEIPEVDVFVPTYDDPQVLLAGPLAQTPLHILPAMEKAFQRIKASLRTSGRKVSYQSLYAHGLAFAYVRSDQWLALAPSDGRREGSHSRLTSENSRITPELPVALIEATHSLMARATIEDSRNAPALESVKTAGLAWALGRYQEWIDTAVSNPIRAGERD